MLDFYAASMLGQLTAKQTPLEWEPLFSGRLAGLLRRLSAFVLRTVHQTLSRLKKARRVRRSHREARYAARLHRFNSGDSAAVAIVDALVRTP